MAYSATNSPKCVVAGFGGGASIWSYESADAHATVAGAGYFTNAKTLGMKVGDIVFVKVTPAYTVTTHAVSAISAGGAATVSAAVLA